MTFYFIIIILSVNTLLTSFHTSFSQVVVFSVANSITGNTIKCNRTDLIGVFCMFSLQVSLVHMFSSSASLDQCVMKFIYLCSCSTDRFHKLQCVSPLKKAHPEMATAERSSSHRVFYIYVNVCWMYKVFIAADAVCRRA